MRKHTYRVVMEAYTDSIGGAASHLRKHEKAHLAMEAYTMVIYHYTNQIAYPIGK